MRRTDLSFCFLSGIVISSFILVFLHCLQELLLNAIITTVHIESYHETEILCLETKYLSKQQNLIPAAL